MGTVWSLSLDLYPIDSLEYHKFRVGVSEQLATRFGTDKYGVYYAVNKELSWNYSSYVKLEADFDGSYSLGEMVFDVFKDYIDKYMKERSAVVISGWEDACGDDMKYVKGVTND